MHADPGEVDLISEEEASEWRRRGLIKDGDSLHSDRVAILKARLRAGKNLTAARRAYRSSPTSVSAQISLGDAEEMLAEITEVVRRRLGLDFEAAPRGGDGRLMYLSDSSGPGIDEDFSGTSWGDKLQ